jgi:hypothetical protein
MSLPARAACNQNYSFATQQFFWHTTLWKWPSKCEMAGTANQWSRIAAADGRDFATIPLNR